MEDYVKTGEDKKYEYYRSDSEVLSGDGEEEPYEEIINKRDKFNVKINDKELIIKKRTLNKIMILSSSQPEEQILFSLYKTISHRQSNDTIRTQPISNDNIRPNNLNDLDSLRQSKGIPFPNIVSNENPNNNNIKLNEEEKNKNELIPENINNVEPQKQNISLGIRINEPLSGEMTVMNNISSNSNGPNLNENVINIPSNEGSDNEEVALQKVNNYNNNNILIVGLPPQAVRIKWFYLLLSLLGIAYIILFIVGLSNEKVGFMFNIFCMCVIGAFLLLTGVFGFTKINNRIYDNCILLIFTVICLIFGVAGNIIIAINEITKRYFVCSLCFGILTVLFSLLCIIWTLQLKKIEQTSKQKQMERLVDKK